MLHSMGWQRVGNDLVTEQQRLLIFINLLFGEHLLRDYSVLHAGHIIVNKSLSSWHL